MKKINSLQLRLTLRLAIVTLLLAIAAGIAAFYAILDEAHEYQDDMLRQTAWLIDVRNPPPRIDIDADIRIDVEPLDRPPPPGRKRRLDPKLRDGFHDVRHQKKRFRAYVRTYPDARRIAFMQETDFREAAAYASAWHAVAPLLLLVPIMGLITFITIRRALKPVHQLSQQVGARRDSDLSPLSTDNIPSEINGFVLAINQLLHCVDRNLREQQRFIADAAHELRSPLTALSLQAERLAAAEMSDEAHNRVTVLRDGIRRNRHLLEQLLALARAQAPEQSPRQAHSAHHLYRRVIQELHVLAEAKQLDLGIDGEQDAPLYGDELSLYTLIRNLVDNAVRYTPDGGQIDLRVIPDARHTILEIEDSGPGIAPAERERVFDPFYRSPGSRDDGSGLGLAIAQTLAAQLGGKMTLHDSQRFASGLLLRIILPAAA